ncbi:MAG: hypothetical protein HZB26_12190 [Candidatus Hydrogenedentes bacterium]|nr:hypothetical protein [Candidatus Hydrogenedentota bacterium]
MSWLDTFHNSPREYTLVPFWFWNDDLTEAELKRQIDDFEAHGVYGFIPHLRLGLPKSIEFMGEAYLRFLKIAVDYAASKNMIVILYDEAMYPSGSCAGQVVAANPRHATRCIDRRKPGPLAGDEYIVAKDADWIYVNCRSMGTIRGAHYGQDDAHPDAPPSGDILNPESTASFLHLVHDKHHEALKEHFGKTVRAIFTDEPNVLGRGGRKDVRPWTWDLDHFLHDYLGYDFRPKLGALWDDTAPDAEKYRREFNTAINARLAEAYYAPYSRWCADHKIALTGHPAGPDDIGVERFFHIPGQDIVWRYIEPFKDKSIEGGQSTMAKCSASAQRHYGRARNLNECFGAYGWEFTYDEMRWITNWLFVRGVNLLTPHAFYYSVRGDRRNERPPDVGPNNTWWDGYKTYADFCRRMCWLLSQGRQVCSIAILGAPNKLPWRAARVLFESQRDFNYLDTDALKNSCRVSSEAIRIQDMEYKALVIDGAEYITPDVLRALKPMLDSGRVLAYVDPAAGVAPPAADALSLVVALDKLVPADITITPKNSGLRYLHLKHPEGDVYVFANEAPEPIDSALTVAAHGPGQWIDPETAQPVAGANPTRAQLPPRALRVLFCPGA